MSGAVPQADAQRIPTLPPIGTDEELIERLRKYGHIEAADALQSRISEVERLTARVRELEAAAKQCCEGGAQWGHAWNCSTQPD